MGEEPFFHIEIFGVHLPHLLVYHRNTKEGKQHFRTVRGKYLLPNYQIPATKKYQIPAENRALKERGEGIKPEFEGQQSFITMEKMSTVNYVVLCEICGYATYTNINCKNPQYISKNI